MPLLAGRWLTTADHFDAPKVALVNKALALQYWPTVEACIGQQIYTRNPMDRDAAMTIVGITGNVKDGPTDAQAPPAIYSPFLQNPSFGNYVVLRAAADPVALAGAVRDVARRVGNDFSIREVRPMKEVVGAAVATERFVLQMVGLFAALALVLIGVYGAISYTITRCSREIAIRSAIGAQPTETLRFVLGQAATCILAGLIVGGLASASLARVLASLLYQVSARDPLTFVAVAVLLALGFRRHTSSGYPQLRAADQGCYLMTPVVLGRRAINFERATDCYCPASPQDPRSARIAGLWRR